MQNQWKAIIGFVALLLAAGCANDVDTSENVLQPNASNVADTAPEVEVQPGDCDNCPQLDQWFRATAIKLNTLDGLADHLAVGALNGEWEKDIGKGELTLFFHVTGMENGQVNFEVVNGARSDVDDTVCIIPERTTPIDTTQSECGVSSNELVNVFIYGGSRNHPKICSPNPLSTNSIYIQGVQFDASLPKECDRMNATVNGVIAIKDLTDTCSCLFLLPGQTSAECGTSDDPPVGGVNCVGCGKRVTSNLEQALGLLAPSREDGTKIFGQCTTQAGAPAVCLEASIEMESVSQPPVCP